MELKDLCDLCASYRFYHGFELPYVHLWCANKKVMRINILVTLIKGLNNVGLPAYRVMPLA